MFKKEAKNFTVAVLTGTSVQHEGYVTIEQAQKYADALTKRGYKWAIMRNSDRAIIAKSEDTVALD